jgi:hypothetical protein
MHGEEGHEDRDPTSGKSIVDYHTELDGTVAFVPSSFL